MQLGTFQQQNNLQRGGEDDTDVFGEMVAKKGRNSWWAEEGWGSPPRTPAVISPACSELGLLPRKQLSCFLKYSAADQRSAGCDLASCDSSFFFLFSPETSEMWSDQRWGWLGVGYGNVQLVGLASVLIPQQTDWGNLPLMWLDVCLHYCLSHKGCPAGPAPALVFYARDGKMGSSIRHMQTLLVIPELCK